MLEAVAFYRPVLPVPWLVLLLAAAVAGVVWLYGRGGGAGPERGRRTLLGLRLAALAAVGWMLAGPSVLEQGQPAREGEGAVTLLVDLSASMGEVDEAAGGTATADGAEHVSRWAALTRTWLSEERLSALERTGRVRLLGFDERVRPLASATLGEHEPAGRATRLFAALDGALADPALSDEPAPVFVLLSDGHDTQRGHDAAMLNRLAERGAVVHVVPVGRPDASAGLAVQAWVEADVLFEGESTTLHVQLWPRGLAGREVEVTLHHEGEPIETRRVRLPADEAVPEPVAFPLAPSALPGQRVTLHAYEVRAEVVGEPAPPTDEAARQAVFVQVSRERIRVALFEGEPYWDTRWLARVLRDDAQVELHAVYHLGPDRRIVQRPANAEPPAAGVPDLDRLDAETLARFDVIVLGKRMERFFPGEAAQRLVDFVREGGGSLVLARGRPFDVSREAGRSAMAVFDPVAPVTWGEQQVASLALQMTPHGQASPLLQFDEWAELDVLTTRLPGMIAATRIERERAASIVLLRQTGPGGGNDAPGDEAGAMAAVVHASVGRGRVMAVLTDGLWQWALLPSELGAYETVYHLFWSRAVRWLATGGEFLPGQDVALTLDRLAVEPGEPVTVTVSTRYVPADFEPTLRVTDPAGTVHTLTPRRDDRRTADFRATYQSDVPGVHRVAVEAGGSPGSAPLIDPDTPLTARLVVEDRSPERLDPAARPSTLAALAEATGGQRFELDEHHRLVELLEDRTLARSVDARPRYVFARWPVLALIVGCLSLEWWLRRRGGLL